MRVQATGAAQISYMWRKNNIAIDASANASVHTSVLQIPQVVPSDAGEYDWYRAAIGLWAVVEQRTEFVTG